MSVSKPWELYYWPDIQGRGEFIRLALEEAGIDYVDVARSHQDGVSSLVADLEAEDIERPPFAPRFLRAADLLIGQTANILMFIRFPHRARTGRRGRSFMGPPTSAHDRRLRSGDS
jgi:glutathione S-transferase